ncbi:MAG: PQQ-binding-like beta-propeller repeat protein, partial [Thermoguttaceae bacterium]
MLAAFRNVCVFWLTIGLMPAGLPALFAQAAPPDAAGRAAEILQTAEFRGGLIVHLGAADARLLAALGAEEGRLVQGLDADPSRVEQARRHLRSLGIYGRVSVDQWTGGRLPYIDNLVNLLVVEEPGAVARGEMLRVLAPRGVACVRQDGRWTTFEKPRPEQIDEWTHFLYDSTNNAVSQDETIAPLRQMQWVGSPRWARHHDHMSSLSALVSSGGRLFYIFDEGSTTSILLPSRWSLIARDAFNGTVLWKRPIEHWHTQLWPLKSGPALLTRRLVAVDDAVYVTLGLHGPLTMLDAATGETRRTFEGTEAAEEIVVRDGAVYLVVNRAPEETWGTYDSIAAVRRGVEGAQWSGGRKTLMALDPESGKVLWEHESFVTPSTLAVDATRVYFHDGRKIVALSRADAAPQWQSEPMPVWATIHSWYTPTLVVYDDVVLWSGGETMIPHRGARDTMYAVSAATGKTLWSAPHAPSGYQSSEDLLVAGGLVWTGATTSGGYDGIFYGHDPHTGEVKKQFAPGVEPYWFHHRCYRGKATENFLLMSRTGIEFLDIERENWELHHWVRGACLTGILPSNGMVYAPPHDCACYPEAKVFGFAALAPATSPLEDLLKETSDVPRLSRGPAYADVQSAPAAAAPQSEAAWPTYRADAARSGYTPAALPAELKPAWQTALGGQLSALSIGGGKVYVATVDDHTVHALHAETGEPVWSYTAGGRVDSPPTLWNDLCLFGSADGSVYCLRAADGELVWRFRAAPIDRRHTNFEQVESVWPVHGSLLVQDGVVYAVAGRSMFLDGGLHWYQLDARTGELLTHRQFDD